MNNLIKRNLPTWRILDSTKIQTFMECPRKFFYEYILGWRPETPSNHLVFGSAGHKAMEYILTNGYSPEATNQAYEVFLEYYRKTFTPDTDSMFAPKTPENFFLVLGRYIGHYKEDLDKFKVLYTEIGGKVTLSEQHELYFRMDTILENTLTKRISSLEHKFSQSDYNWELQWPLSVQVGTYTHILNCLYDPKLVDGVTINGIFFRKVKKGWEQLMANKPLTVEPPYMFKRFPAQRSLEHMEVWLWNTIFWMDFIKWQYELLEKANEDDSILMAFPMNPTSCTKYFGCAYHDYCMAWLNPLKRSEEPPIGYVEEHWDPTKEEVKHKFDITMKED